MKFNTPLPQPLPKECEKAAKIFKSFVDNGNNGLDGIIPRQVLENAKGFAIFTIIKAGFLFSARAGSGVVIAKLDDGTWSAPSAIGSAGLGVGGQAGAEMTDFLVVLNSRSAVRSFMSAGSLTLGGNMSIALGPLGRNGEALGSLNTSGKVAAMYSYSKTRGLFGGVSIEGSVIVERQDANALAYKSDVTVKQLLSGAIEPPEWAQPLIKTLEACVGMPGGQKWVDDSANADINGTGGSGKSKSKGNTYAFGAGAGIASPSSELPPSIKKKRNSIVSPFPPPHWGKAKSNGSYFSSELASDLKTGSDNNDSSHIHAQNSIRTSPRVPPVANLIDDSADSSTSNFATHFNSDFVPPSFSSRKSFLQPTHRPTLSLQSPAAHVSSFNPDSPFNDLPPFPKHNTLNSHNRSISSASYLGVERSTSNSYSGSSSAMSSNDPFSSFAEQVDGDVYRRALGDKPKLIPKAGLSGPLSPHEGVGRAIALYNFKAVESGDLSFNKGQVITIIKKTNKTEDWWTGKVDGREGVFPANFVEVV